jgi:rhodanese-related sulfurtransferase
MSKKLLAALTVSLALVFAACSPQTTDTADTQSETEEPEQVEIIHNTPEEFEAAMEGEYLLLDVRTQAEYDEGHINDPTLIPVTELESRLDEISEYKDKPVLVYCRSGNRSVTASNILIENGFSEVHNLLGGIGAWNAYKAD